MSQPTSVNEVKMVRQIFNNEAETVNMSDHLLDKMMAVEYVTNIKECTIVKNGAGKKFVKLNLEILISDDVVEIPNIITLNQLANIEIFPNVMSVVYVARQHLSRKLKDEIQANYIKASLPINE